MDASSVPAQNFGRSRAASRALLCLGFGVLLVLLAALGIVSSARLRAVGKQVDALGTVVGPRAAETWELETGFRDYVLEVRYHLDGDPRAQERALQAAQDIEDTLASYMRMAESPQQRLSGKRFSEFWQELNALGTALLTNPRQAQSDMGGFEAAAAKVEEFLETHLQREAVEDYRGETRRVRRRLADTETLMLILLISSVGLGLLTSFSVVRMIVQGETALRESELFHRQTLESIPGMVFTTRPDGFCDYQSQQWEEYTGVPLAEQLGDGWTRLLFPDDRDRAFSAWRTAVETNSRYDIEYRVRRRDGRYEWFKVIGHPIRDRSGHVARWFGVAFNVQNLKEAETELRETRDQLAGVNANLEHMVQERTAKLLELVAELEHFSYTITHDMRAPLRAMRGYAEILSERDPDVTEAEREEFLERIRRAANRMDLLITDALSYSKAVREELALSRVEPELLLRGMIETYPEFQPNRAKIEIVGKIPAVTGNEAGLIQCFSNLLGNAVKFVKPGQRAEVKIRAETRPGWVRLWFEDKGIGIAETMLPHLFEMFARGHQDYEGTGIGLALVRKVMERMGGNLGVESEEGRGSRFWLDLRPAGWEAKSLKSGQHGRNAHSAAAPAVKAI